MKKLLTAIILLLISLIYVIYRVTKASLYLPEFSINAKNPVSLHWNFIAIDTGITQGGPGSIYWIWMTPIYLLVLVSLILTFLAFKKKR
ncbi:hypothetical protein BIV60_02365 [Bacillus sp. MUM 116]|uniref:hypothetical protein n=1 Tax=Bacillus sp. MUM 116 TaxID=1678002 RepID=UPI0008F58A89|nr:hypothetical protein [Bacillus sp. MUM 116]OIK16876.1 hypothetical protein BIV60_02365 [Bacillus sp. MUM 116]